MVIAALQNTLVVQKVNLSVEFFSTTELALIVLLMQDEPILEVMDLGKSLSSMITGREEISWLRRKTENEAF
jgi:hypothetical protein